MTEKSGRGGQRPGSGRKPGPTPPRVVVSAAIPPEVRGVLIEVAQTRHISLSAYIALILDEWWEHNR